MIKPPFTAKWGLSGVWIEDSSGLSLLNMSPLIDPMEAFRIADLLASGTNKYMRIANAARESGKLGGRPEKKKARGKLTGKKSRSKREPSAERRKK